MWQSLCMIKVSDGLCKRGCDPITGHRLRRSTVLTNSTNANASAISAKASEICQIYIGNFVRQAPNNLTE